MKRIMPPKNNDVEGIRHILQRKFTALDLKVAKGFRPKPSEGQRAQELETENETLEECVDILKAQLKSAKDANLRQTQEIDHLDQIHGKQVIELKTALDTANARIALLEKTKDTIKSQKLSTMDAQIRKNQMEIMELKNDIISAEKQREEAERRHVYLVGFTSLVLQIMKDKKIEQLRTDLEVKIKKIKEENATITENVDDFRTKEETRKISEATSSITTHVAQFSAEIDELISSLITADNLQLAEFNKHLARGKHKEGIVPINLVLRHRSHSQVEELKSQNEAIKDKLDESERRVDIFSQILTEKQIGDMERALRSMENYWNNLQQSDSVERNNQEKYLYVDYAASDAKTRLEEYRALHQELAARLDTNKTDEREQANEKDKRVVEDSLATWCFVNGKWGPVHVSDLLSRDQ